MNRQAKKLRELIDRKGSVISVGVWDAFSAKVAEREGFEVLGVMGSLISRSMIGKTDYGYITQTEMLDAAQRITQAVDVPLIVDCDDGFGDPLNVRRTVKLFEQVGAAGLIIEDLQKPLRCSASGGGRLGPAEAMVQKIRAAIEARSNPNLVIIARTDEAEGVDEVISRIAAYGKAGANMGFVHGLKRVEDMVKVSREAPIPLVAIQAKGSITPLISPDKLEAMGFKIIHYNRALYGPAALALRNAARELKIGLEDRSKIPLKVAEMSATELEEIVGLAEDSELQERYIVFCDYEVNHQR